MVDGKAGAAGICYYGGEMFFPIPEKTCTNARTKSKHTLVDQYFNHGVTKQMQILMGG
jgi:hypothetical protein